VIAKYLTAPEVQWRSGAERNDSIDALQSIWHDARLARLGPYPEDTRRASVRAGARRRPSTAGADGLYCPYTQRTPFVALTM